MPPLFSRPQGPEECMDAAKTDDNIHGRCHFDSLTHAGLFLLE
jgi:hypothetical protein